MSHSATIFCSAELLPKVKESFPETQVLGFASDLDQCRDQVDQLGPAKDRVAVLLFSSPEQQQGNPSVIDHINLSHENPLIGPADLTKGPRFPDMSAIYEKQTEGLVVVMGDDPALKEFKEPWAPVQEGVWEAIALKHRGFQIHAWLINDLEKWVSEQSIIH